MAFTLQINYHALEQLKVACVSYKESKFRFEDAWGWCTGTTQRNGMGREEGGGFRMGNLVGCRLWGHTELDTTEAT